MAAQVISRTRSATPSDLAALVTLEELCFDGDRISRRQFRHLLTQANASITVVERNGDLIGDVVVLFNRATSVARLYSIAVSPCARGLGIARALVEAAEMAAWGRGRPWMRLEVRKDNAASMSLFESLGYHRFGQYPDYYADHADAWRYEKILNPALRPHLAKIAYYRQSLDFTCGAAALMMALHALDPAVPLERRLEIQLWREATTIFMTSGHGGCGPYGLALAAASRGFRVEVHVSSTGVHLVESVRDARKKAVMHLVQDDMEDQLSELGVPIHEREISLDEVRARFDAGALPLALISSWQIYEARVPHWVLITGFDDQFVYMHDPFVDADNGETETDSMHTPIAHDTFRRMARYGRQ
ncbi:MAG: peptidase C39 family protein, partial [Gammaproteobacteria bacterium]